MVPIGQDARITNIGNVSTTATTKQEKHPYQQKQDNKQSSKQIIRYGQEKSSICCQGRKNWGHQAVEWCLLAS